MEREMREVKAALDARAADIRTKTAAISAAEDQVSRLEQNLRDSQVCRRSRILVFLMAVNGLLLAVVVETAGLRLM